MAKATRKEIFETLPVPQAVQKMILPTIFSQIIVLIYNMADTFFVGHTENSALMVAATSLILPVFNICIAFSGLTGIGGGSLVSRMLGEKREDEAKRISAFSFYLSIFIAACFSLGVLLGMDPLLHFLGVNEDTLPYARQYAFCVIVLGAVPTLLSNVLSNLLRSVGASREAGFGITLGGVINIGLDPLFMFLLFPKGMEVMGVGIATFLSNCIACGYFAVVLFRQRKKLPLSFSLRRGLPEKKSIASFFGVGIPSSITTLLFDIDYMVIGRLINGYKDVANVAMSAIGIVLKVERLPLNVGIGICQGMMPMIAYNFASGDRRRMQAISRYSLTVGLVVSAVSIFLYELFSPQIMSLFIPNAPDTAVLGAEFLRIRILATPLMFCSFFTVYTFQGFGEGRISLFLGIMRWAVFNIPMLYLLNHLIGMYGLVWSQVTADTLTVILSVITYARYSRTRLRGPA